MDVAVLFATLPPYVALGIPIYIYYRMKNDKDKIESVVSKADLALKELKECKAELKEHKIECNEIKKEVLLEKIANLDDKFCAYLESAAEFRKDMKEEFKLQRERAHALNNTLQQIMFSKDKD